MIFSLIIGIMLLSSKAYGAVPVPKLDNTGAITLSLRYGEEKTPAAGGEFSIYQVAHLEKEGGLVKYVFNDKFKGCGEDLSLNESQQMAERLAAYTTIRNIEGYRIKTDRNGYASYKGIQLGLYLIKQTKAADGFYPVAPFLVSVPLMDTDGQTWIYDVDATPKLELWPFEEGQPVENELTVRKVWIVEDDVVPRSVEINLLKDGKIADSVFLSGENGWKHTWTQLDQKFIWSVEEKDVPDGYAVSYSKQGNIVTVTNTQEVDIPDDDVPLDDVPDEPYGPKTGDDFNQYYWLAVAGLALIYITVIAMNREKKK